MARFEHAQDIKVGIIGYGGAFNMGKGHMSQLIAQGATPVAVAEPDAARRAVAAEEFPGIETYASGKELLEKSDANFIAIITPHNTHFELAAECLKAGRSVCCEKPLAVTTAHCRELIKLADENNVLLTTYHNRHWDGGICKAMDFVKQGLIGEVVRVDVRTGGHRCPGKSWRGSKSISGGLLYDFGVHFTEYALQLLDDEMVEIFGWARCGYWNDKSPWGDDVNEDEAMAVVRFRGGALYTLRMTSLDPEVDPYSVKVTGTQGTILFSPHGNYRLVSIQHGEKLIAEGQEPPPQWHRFYENVVDHLVNDADLVITAAYATRCIHVLELAGRSAREGRTLPTEMG